MSKTKLVVRESLGFRLKERMPVQLHCGDESRTKQSFKEDCDINNIVRKFADGVMPVTNPVEPQYGDSPTMDLKEALDAVFHAKGEFNALSEDDKSLFDFDQSNYFDFLADPDRFYNEIRAGFGDQKSAKNDSGSPSEEPSET